MHLNFSKSFLEQNAKFKDEASKIKLNVLFKNVIKYDEWVFPYFFTDLSDTCKTISSEYFNKRMFSIFEISYVSLHLIFTLILLSRRMKKKKDRKEVGHAKCVGF